MVGLPPSPLQLKPFNFIPRRLRIGGSLIGGIRETQEMLDFCAAHRLSADVEVISAKQVNKAWCDVAANKIERARYVIDIFRSKSDVGGSRECDALDAETIAQPKHPPASEIEHTEDRSFIKDNPKDASSNPTRKHRGFYAVC